MDVFCQSKANTQVSIQNFPLSVAEVQTKMASNSGADEKFNIQRDRCTFTYK